MRTFCVIALALGGLGSLGSLGACTPEIVPGAYLCGPEQACPEGLACDGAEDVCVLPSAARPFACAGTEREPNDDPASAHDLGLEGCVSPLVEIAGCSVADDGDDWYAFEAPASCSGAVGVRFRVSFRGAYEELGLELHDAEGGVLATGAACANDDPFDADELRCLEHALTPGERYALRVFRSGEGGCDGACSFNRYLLNAQLAAP